MKSDKNITISVMFISHLKFLELQTDEDGNPICLLCDEKLNTENDWIEHIELEKSKLIKNIAR